MVFLIDKSWRAFWDKGLTIVDVEMGLAYL